MVLRFDILINCCKTHEVAQDRFAISSLPIFFEIRNFIINIMQPRIKLGCKKKVFSMYFPMQIFLHGAINLLLSHLFRV